MSSNIQECSTIQLLEPNSDVPVGIAGETDPALDERGEEVLTTGQSEAVITFTKPKISAMYRFEYLYVDAIDIVQPGVISVVPVQQTAYGFTVELAGQPVAEGYILRWRVVVISTEVMPTPTPDIPESIYVQLPQSSVHSVMFNNPRSTQDYGFSELRIENLIDLPGLQVVIVPQVIVKLQEAFTVKLSQVPNNNNYYLVARTP